MKTKLILDNLLTKQEFRGNPWKVNLLYKINRLIAAIDHLKATPVGVASDKIYVIYKKGITDPYGYGVTLQRNKTYRDLHKSSFFICRGDERFGQSPDRNIFFRYEFDKTITTHGNKREFWLPLTKLDKLTPDAEMKWKDFFTCVYAIEFEKKFEEVITLANNVTVKTGDHSDAAANTVLNKSDKFFGDQIYFGDLDKSMHEDFLIRCRLQRYQEQSNRNGRIYSDKLWNREINKYFKTKQEEQKMIVETVELREIKQAALNRNMANIANDLNLNIIKDGDGFVFVQVGKENDLTESGIPAIPGNIKDLIYKGITSEDKDESRKFVSIAKKYSLIERITYVDK